jgi:heme oxygenase
LVSAMATLRACTRDSHARVDSAFSAYDLHDEESYRAFLTAHARALPSVERIIASEAALPRIRPRTPALEADMAQLQQPMPELSKLAGPVTGAAAWGILYVVEGSRLGGAILSPRVGDGLPKAYLSARHELGEWRAICQALDAEGSRHGDEWIAAAVVAATACFDLYRTGCTA